MNKQLWLLVGGNGAGKSRFYEIYLKPLGLSFVNADLLAQELADKISPKVSRKAQELAWASCIQKLDAGETFCFETVFSRHSKLNLIQLAKNKNYTVIMIFIHLRMSQLNVARVMQRVKSGGHDVPRNKIESRINRTLENVKQAMVASSFEFYAANPRHVLSSAAVGSALHLEPIPLSAYFFISPLGYIVTSLPISPAGIGVGQAGFLFFFNAYLGHKSPLGPISITVIQILQFIWSLSGLYFYLARRDRRWDGPRDDHNLDTTTRQS